MNLLRVLCTCTLLLLAAAGSAQAQQRCRVEPFQGATLPQGAVAYMRVVNTGDPCVIVNFGLPSERANPAESGNITKQPAHGKAEFAAPEARYAPKLGYVGEDEFEFEAFAKGRVNQQVRLTVQVKITVTAP
jgi:hypothetical protein